MDGSDGLVQKGGLAPLVQHVLKHQVVAAKVTFALETFQRVRVQMLVELLLDPGQHGSLDEFLFLKDGSNQVLQFLFRRTRPDLLRLNVLLQILLSVGGFELRPLAVDFPRVC
jgi:hypothetical protein